MWRGCRTAARPTTSERAWSAPATTTLSASGARPLPREERVVVEEEGDEDRRAPFEWFRARAGLASVLGTHHRFRV